MMREMHTRGGVNGDRELMLQREGGDTAKDEAGNYHGEPEANGTQKACSVHALLVAFMR
jgi:hypothetical protein